MLYWYKSTNTDVLLQVDAPRILAALEYVMQKKGREEGSAARLPIVALGASSGACIDGLARDD